MFRFKIENGGCIIIGYEGDASEIIIPEERFGFPVTTIGNDAFNECKNLTRVTIPNSVTAMGANPFSSCEKLSDIIVPFDHPVYTLIDGVLVDRIKRELVCYPRALGSQSYAIPHGIFSIGAYAFHGSSLQYIIIPNSVTAIGDNAFCGCIGMTDIFIPDSVTTIGDDAFCGCMLRSVIIPDSVTFIGSRAFEFCNELTYIVIPDSVTAMGMNPFADCRNLSRIIVSQDHPVFATIDGVLFDKTKKQLICYPRAFGNQSYVIPQGIRSIGSYAFFHCTTLRSIQIPNSVTAIEEGAFSWCMSLTSIVLPEGLTSIPAVVPNNGDPVFFLCENLRSITIPNGVTAISAEMFDLCDNLSEIIVAPDHPVLATIHGVLFDKTEKQLIYCPPALHYDSYVIPQGIQSIADEAFCSCPDLKNITIPDSVVSIGKRAFYTPYPMTFTVKRNSFAHEYAKANDIPFVYSDQYDWLNS